MDLRRSPRFWRSTVEKMAPADANADFDGHILNIIEQVWQGGAILGSDVASGIEAGIRKDMDLNDCCGGGGRGVVEPSFQRPTCFFHELGSESLRQVSAPARLDSRCRCV